MSVRAWFVISALVLVALAVAFVLRFFAPVPAPEIVARAGAIRLAGHKTAECWPQRDGNLRCRNYKPDSDQRTRLRGSGTIHVAVAFPARPEGGSLTLTAQDGTTVVTTTWKETLDYRAPPGSYHLRALATYPEGAKVDYVFPITVTSSGS